MIILIGMKIFQMSFTPLYNLSSKLVKIIKNVCFLLYKYLKNPVKIYLHEFSFILYWGSWYHTWIINFVGICLQLIAETRIIKKFKINK